MYPSGETFKINPMNKTQTKFQVTSSQVKSQNEDVNMRGKRNTPLNEYGMDAGPTRNSQSSQSGKKHSRPLSVGTNASRGNNPSKKNEEEDYELIDINTMLLQEEDERFRYLLKYGNIKKLEKNNTIIFAELPQIPGVLVFYRKVQEKEANPESQRLFLDNKDLSHIPLLEGEEGLKLLSLKQNQIERIQNLVSLPNLIYLDLSNNFLPDLDNLSGIPTLRVLIAAKNRLTRLRNLENLHKLEILDVNGNSISMMDGLKALTELRTLNLENNAISRLEDIAHLYKLNELNLAGNKVENLDPLGKMKNLSKLYVSKNFIAKPRGITALKYMPKLIELTLDENPIAADKPSYYQIVTGLCTALETLDSVSIQKIEEGLYQNKQLGGKEDENKIDSDDGSELERQKSDKENESDHGRGFSKGSDKSKRKDSASKSQGKSMSKYKSVSPTKKNGSQVNSATKPKPPFINNVDNLKDKSSSNPDEEEKENNDSNLEPEKVIEIIREQFDREIQRVERLRKQGVTARKELYKESVLEGGHAEMENNSILYLYGNAFEVMLPNQSFQTTVEEIHFEYVIFDLLAQTKYMNYLKQYKGLRKIILKHNNIHSFLQIAKLEALSALTSLSISDNPVCSCELLKEFVIYRFPDLTYFNDASVEENQRINAKNKFKEFDNVLVFPLEFYKDGYRGHNAQKTVDEYSEAAASKALTDAIDLKNKKDVFEVIWDSYVTELTRMSLNHVKSTKNPHY